MSEHEQEKKRPYKELLYSAIAGGIFVGAVGTVVSVPILILTQAIKNRLLLGRHNTNGLDLQDLLGKIIFYAPISAALGVVMAAEEVLNHKRGRFTDEIRAERFQSHTAAPDKPSLRR